MFKTIIAAVLVSLTFAATANAGAGGNGSGNPRNEWDKQPVGQPHYVWKEGKLVSAKEKSSDVKVGGSDEKKDNVASK